MIHAPIPVSLNYDHIMFRKRFCEIPHRPYLYLGHMPTQIVLFTGLSGRFCHHYLFKNFVWLFIHLTARAYYLAIHNIS